MRLFLRAAGEALITAGLVLLLFCAYQLVWTNVEADRAQAKATEELREQWRRNSAGTPAAAEADRPNRPDPAVVSSERSPAPGLGDPLAMIYIPALGDDYSKPVLEGVHPRDLGRGIGHYPETAMPGEVGNFAVAGHRTTRGQPFHDLDRLEPGDPVVVETGDSWFTYVVTDSEIVLPTRREVLLPVPKRPGGAPTEPLLTLTTCHPRWSDSHRLIVYATLSSEQDKTDGRPEALAG